MKLTPFYKEAQEKMAPGEITESGFLGDDKRSIIEIIEEDEQIMAKLGLDWEKISEKLEHLIREGAKGLGEYCTVDNKWLVKVDETRGKLPSPFKDGLFFKRSVTVQNKTSKKSLIYSDLSLHMLKKYHFLQGKGSSFRLDPELIQSVLEL